MEFKNLLNFIDAVNDRLIENFDGQSTSVTERVLIRTVKLNEEVGELCNEVLLFSGNQRQEKLAKYDGSNLANEFADVIITTLLLAKTMDVNIQEALERKINKINERFQAI